MERCYLKHLPTLRLVLADELVFLHEFFYICISLGEKLNCTMFECSGCCQSARSVKESRACLEVTDVGIYKCHEHVLAETVIGGFVGLGRIVGVNFAVLGRAIHQVAENPIQPLLTELVGEPLCGTAFDSHGFIAVLVEGEEHRHALTTSHHSSHLVVGFEVVVNFGCRGFYIDCKVHFVIGNQGIGQPQRVVCFPDFGGKIISPRNAV